MITGFFFLAVENEAVIMIAETKIGSAKSRFFFMS